MIPHNVASKRDSEPRSIRALHQANAGCCSASAPELSFTFLQKRQGIVACHFHFISLGTQLLLAAGFLYCNNGKIADWGELSHSQWPRDQLPHLSKKWLASPPAIMNTWSQSKRCGNSNSIDCSSVQRSSEQAFRQVLLKIGKERLLTPTLV